MRRITLFDELGRSPDSGSSRQLITNSSAYGLTTGSYQADYIELTEDGRRATNPDAGPAEKLQARFRLAIARIPPFNALFEHFAGNKLPSPSVMRDFLLENGIEKDEVAECIDCFTANINYLGLLKTIAGAERILTLDHALDELPRHHHSAPTELSSGATLAAPVTKAASDAQQARTEWDRICFYITPIGEADSEERRHADLMMGSFIEPAMEQLGLKVIRADQIGDAGMIATQVMQHLRHAKLAIADFSFLNPNVFYEMALRHARKLPVVQIIRRKDRLPFDVNQVRTVVLDTTDIYTLVPKIELYRSEIAAQARAALDDPESVGNPVSVFYPRFYD